MDRDATGQDGRRIGRAPRRLPAVAIAAGLGILLVVASLSTAAVAVVLWEGLIAAGILLAGSGLGLWIVRLLGLHRAEPRWQLLLGSGLGIGGLSLLMLALGLAGMLDRAIWLALLVLFAALGIWRLTAILRHAPAVNHTEPSTNNRMRWLWLGLIIIAAFGFIGGTFPPGILWPAEGNGYDVLEYHLAVPREHFESGEVAFLPHNVYSNFPLNVEMLYLLSIVLHDQPIAAMFTAKMIHVWLAVLAVGAVWLAGREYDRSSGIVAGVCFATTPFVAYLCGLAYVENGLLFFAALAIAAVVKTHSAPPGESKRWALGSGLLAGLACGCKYTAAPMLALPLGIAIGWRSLTARSDRLALLPLFAMGCAITLGPWLIKNAAMTGNPVFPLARDVFPERDGVWNDDCAERWRQGHEPGPDEQPLAARVQRLWSSVLTGKLFGPIFGLLAVAGVFMIAQALSRRRRQPSPPEPNAGLPAARTPVGTIACWLVVLIGLIIWTGWTHLVDRFALLLIAPAAILIGVAWSRLVSPGARLCGLLVLISLLVVNTLAIGRLYTAHPFVVAAPSPTNGASESQPFSITTSVKHINFLDLNAFGDNTLFTSGRWPFASHVARINELATPDHRLLVIGDAKRFYLNANIDYCVVFSPFPFVSVLSEGLPADVITWLRARQYAHLYVDWAELQRFRETRYGVWQGLPVNLRRYIEDMGLKPVEDFFMPNERLPYSTLFRVPFASETGSGG